MHSVYKENVKYKELSFKQETLSCMLIQFRNWYAQRNETQFIHHHLNQFKLKGCIVLPKRIVFSQKELSQRTVICD